MIAWLHCLCSSKHDAFAFGLAVSMIRSFLHWLPPFFSGQTRRHAAGSTVLLMSTGSRNLHHCGIHQVHSTEEKVSKAWLLLREVLFEHLLLSASWSFCWFASTPLQVRSMILSLFQFVQQLSASEPRVSPRRRRLIQKTLRYKCVATPHDCSWFSIPPTD